MKATKAKVENYTAAQASELSVAYLAATDQAGRDKVVADFSAKWNKSPRSIISKLSNMKIWKKAEKTTKAGTPVISKEDLLVKIQAQVSALGGNPADFESLLSASKNCMFAVQSVLVKIATLEAELDEYHADDVTTGEIVAA